MCCILTSIGAVWIKLILHLLEMKFLCCALLLCALAAGDNLKRNLREIYEIDSLAILLLRFSFGAAASCL
jgi:hypothetical protein